MHFHILLIFFGLSPRYLILFLDIILLHVPCKCHVYACEWSVCRAELVREGSDIEVQLNRSGSNDPTILSRQGIKATKIVEGVTGRILKSCKILLYCYMCLLLCLPFECGSLVLYYLAHKYTPTRDRDISTRDSLADFREVTGHVVRGSHG